jgi:hypothetical protein
LRHPITGRLSGDAISARRVARFVARLRAASWFFVCFVVESSFLGATRETLEGDTDQPGVNLIAGW